MKRFTWIPVGLLLVALAAETARAQRGLPPAWPRGIPNISGLWYMNGDPNQPCEIRQRGDGREAMFINENGSSAPGLVRADHVWIPDWTDGRSQGLLGRIRGNRIVWPNGTYWSR